MTQKHKTKGFTLIELMLAMSFISMLLLSIAMVAIQAGKIYNRGLTLSSLNQSWRDVSDMLRRDFLQTDQRRVSVDASGTDRVIMLSHGGSERSGRFCLGQYSYLWNVPAVLDDISTPTDGPIVRDTSGNPITFVRVVDENGELCAPLPDGSYRTDLPDASRVTHLLKMKDDTSDIVLAIHTLTIRPIALVDNSSDGLFTIDVTIGTSKLSEIDSQGCLPPSEGESNLEFCAINQFNMVARTNG